jgi:hypothetical protein
MTPGTADRTMAQTELIEQLIESFTKQTGWYRRLNDLGQQILGKVVLSRGNLAGILPLFEEKRRLLDEIMLERHNIQGDVDAWQEMKSQVGGSSKADALDDILGKAEAAIAEFMRSEEQLSKRLQHYMGEETTENDG